MRALRRAEVICGVLAGILGLLASIVLLVVPYSNGIGRVIVNGQVVRTVHSQTSFMDHYGPVTTVILLGAIALLSAVILLASVLHSPSRAALSLALLWIAPLALCALAVRYPQDVGVILEPAIALGLVCAISGSIWQLRPIPPARA